MDDLQKIIAALDRIEARLDKIIAPRPASAPASSGAVFPPYGRSKGRPIYGASRGDLDYYAEGARRSLADTAKARWHDKERMLLADIEMEIDRQEALAGSVAGQTEAQPPPPGDDDMPF